MSVSFDLDAWSDAELDLISAKAVLSVLQEAIFHDHADKTYEEAAMAAQRLIDSALVSLESGRHL